MSKHIAFLDYFTYNYLRTFQHIFFQVDPLTPVLIQFLQKCLQTELFQVWDNKLFMSARIYFIYMFNNDWCIGL
jgi:hypothetical protein